MNKFNNYKMTCMDNFSKKQEILKIYNYWNKFNLLNKYNKIQIIYKFLNQKYIGFKKKNNYKVL